MSFSKRVFRVVVSGLLFFGISPCGADQLGHCAKHFRSRHHNGEHNRTDGGGNGQTITNGTNDVVTVGTQVLGCQFFR